MTDIYTSILNGLNSLQGTQVGVSNWITIDQSRIDAFAETTEDHQYIHVDPTRAKETAFGGTIAHGFLCLSLLSRMAYEALPRMEADAVILNYGLNRCRFVSPIPSGSRVRGRFVVKTVAPKPVDGLLTSYEVTVEIEGGEKPALVAEWLVLLRI